MSSDDSGNESGTGAWRATEQDHRKAYEIWRVKKTLSAVIQELGWNYRTIKAWSEKEYKCRYNCLWHGWDDLLAAENDIVKTKMEALFANPVDPTDPTQNITFQRDVEIKVRHHRLALAGMMRSDLERLTHLELLYGMVFFRMTGIKLETGAICDARGISMTFEEMFEKMPELKSFEGGLGSLSKLISMIDALRIRAGLIKETGEAKDTSEVKEEEEAKSADRSGELTLQDLRDWKAVIDRTPPDKRAALKAMMESENRVINAS